MMWETPEVLHRLVSGLHETNVGVDGELVEPTVAEERGYIVEKHNTTVQISIPYNAEGGHRKVRRHKHKRCLSEYNIKETIDIFNSN